MIKLNDSDISVGYIKQILKNFNLPNCQIGKENAESNKHYIDNGFIWLKAKTSEDDKMITPYIEGDFYPNLTSNLKIENNLYDRYTHRYLGKYLRFIRDYKGVDLMPLYNLFDSDIYNTELIFSTKIGETTEQGKTVALYAEHEFGGVTEQYTTYAIPVMPNNIYTLALQTHLAVEMCLTIENYKQQGKSDSTLSNLAQKSFCKKVIAQFESLDKLFSKLDNTLIATIKQHKENLRLLIKVPTNLRSSIVLIEGNNNSFKYSDASKFFINSQLLNYTNNKSYLLADRIIEYLSHNAICPLSEDYDIKKVQYYLAKHGYVKADYPGFWSKEDTKAIRDIIIEKNIHKNNFDMLGYCDKEIERLFGLEDKSGITIVDTEI